MSGYLLWLIIVVAVVILVPLAAAVIRSIDYKRQISGKRQMRTLKEGEQAKAEGGAPDMDMDLQNSGHTATGIPLQMTIDSRGKSPCWVDVP